MIMVYLWLLVQSTQHDTVGRESMHAGTRAHDPPHESAQALSALRPESEPGVKSSHTFLMNFYFLYGLSLHNTHTQSHNNHITQPHTTYTD